MIKICGGGPAYWFQNPGAGSLHNKCKQKSQKNFAFLNLIDIYDPGWIKEGHSNNILEQNRTKHLFLPS